MAAQTATRPGSTLTESQRISAAAHALVVARREKTAAEANEKQARMVLLNLLPDGTTAYKVPGGYSISLVDRTRETFNLAAWRKAHPRSFRRFRGFVRTTPYTSVNVT